MNYFVYIVKCSDGSFYCGYTNNLDERVKEHNKGERGARYTKYRRPVNLVYFESYLTQKEAMRREKAIKGYKRVKKEELVSSLKSV